MSRLPITGIPAMSYPANAAPLTRPLQVSQAKPLTVVSTHAPKTTAQQIYPSVAPTVQSFSTCLPKSTAVHTIVPSSNASLVPSAATLTPARVQQAKVLSANTTPATTYSGISQVTATPVNAAQVVNAATVVSAETRPNTETPPSTIAVPTYTQSAFVVRHKAEAISANTAPAATYSDVSQVTATSVPPSAISRKPMSDDREYHHLYKFVLCGDHKSGKTFLLSRFISDELPEHPTATIGVQFETAIEELPNGERVKMQLWDTAGHSRYRAITQSHYRKAAGGIICYDITDKNSFENVRHWHKALLENADEHVCTILVGTKLDLADRGSRQVAYDEGAKLAEELHSTFIETSAESDINVIDAFEQILHNVYFKKQGISGFKFVLVTVRKDHVPDGHEQPVELHFTNVAGEEILKMQFDRRQHNFASIMTSLQETLKDVEGIIQIILEDGTLVADDTDLSSFVGGIDAT